MPKVEPSIASMQRPTSHMETSIDRVQTSMPQVEPSIAQTQRRTPSIPACTDLVQTSMSQAELFISAMQQRSSATQARIALVQNSAQAIHSMNTRDGIFQWQHATMSPQQWKVVSSACEDGPGGLKIPSAGSRAGRRGAAAIPLPHAAAGAGSGQA
ncbi:MAG: hypothetical protein V5B60_13415 [Accumulibacter sp.]|jgi:hypothetical protein|uniref:hypothetical protein n=1 Tax=Accumulibacter sp. TaxID=2053492 RepID=UPI002FC31B25